MKLSVIVASKLGAPFLDRCLAALVGHTRHPDEEIIVVTSCEATAERWRGRAPGLRVVTCPAPATIPGLRRRGVEEAGGDRLAFVEERCVPGTEWLACIRELIAEDADTIAGGPVAPADYRRIVDWAVYFCEYSEYLPAPLGDRARARGAVTTASATYRRGQLAPLLPLLDHGYWELVAHPLLRGQGVDFEVVSDLVVRKQGGFRFGAYLRQRYWFSRAYAGVRAGSDRRWRWGHLLASVLVPGLLLGRIAGRVWRTGRYGSQLAAALPLMMVVVTVWAAGEWVGCLAGAGDALARVE